MGIYAAGEVIRRTRESLGMTQEELCEGICDVVTLSRIENGRNTPSRANFELLMERMGKSGKKYLPFIRSGDIRDHLLREELERLIGIYDYQMAKQVLDELAKHLEKGDAVNWQYILRMQAAIEYRLGLISVSERRNLLEKAVQCTGCAFTKLKWKNGNMTEQEMGIICNIAMTYMEEEQYEKSIEILEGLKRYLESVYFESKTRIYRLVISNLGHVFGRSGDAKQAKELKTQALKLAIKENNAGSMAGILYDIAYENEKLGQKKDICLKQLVQAYILAECTNSTYLIKHIEEHATGSYEWKRVKHLLENDHSEA